MTNPNLFYKEDIFYKIGIKLYLDSLLLEQKKNKNKKIIQDSLQKYLLTLNFDMITLINDYNKQIKNTLINDYEIIENKIYLLEETINIILKTNIF